MSHVEVRPFGDTGLSVSALGLGAGPLGDPSLDERDASALLEAALSLGVTLIDTAPSYGASEERLGRLLAPVLGRERDRVVLSTKVGYGIEGVPDWTGPCIAAGVERARARLRVDVVDVVHLHSCPRAVLERGEVVEALLEQKRAGKIRAAAYSGDNDALWGAVISGRASEGVGHAVTPGRASEGVGHAVTHAFDSVQCSFNVVDRCARNGAIPEAKKRGMGVLAKRALANAAWRFSARPDAHDTGPYWDRLQALSLGELAREHDVAPDELALRFAAFSEGIDAVLVGTTKAKNLERAAKSLAKGPLPAALTSELERRYRERGAHWGAIV